MSKRSLPPLERFWPKVDKNGPVPSHAPHLGPCWLWTGYRRNGRYPWMYYNGRPMAAYRVAYIELIGPIPEGMQLDHLCRVAFCVNPAHLEPVTQQENIRRQMAAITECPQRHPYTPENTAYDRRGRRFCRTCSRIKSRERDRNRPLRQCEHCASPYKPTRYDQRFCSKRCARRAQLAR